MGLLAEMIGTGFIIVMVLMSIVWLIYLFTKKTSVINSAWAAGFALIGIAYTLMGDGDFWRRCLLFVMIEVWSVRLFVHLFNKYGVISEDSRYQELDFDWVRGGQFTTYFTFALQGLFILFLSLPFLIVSLNSTPGFEKIEWIGFAVWLIGISGESLTRRQLQLFRAKPQNAGKLCKVGLWRFSWNPNYFFQFVVWIGFAVFALGSPWGWIALYTPILVLYLFVQILSVQIRNKPTAV